MMWLVAGLVIGLGVFLMIRRKWKVEDKLDLIKDKKITCPYCLDDMVKSKSYKRSGLRGDFFDCAKCGKESIWDISRDPPALRSKVSSEPRKPDVKPPLPWRPRRPRK